MLILSGANMASVADEREAGVPIAGPLAVAVGDSIAEYLPRDGRRAASRGVGDLFGAFPEGDHVRSSFAGRR